MKRGDEGRTGSNKHSEHGWGFLRSPKRRKRLSYRNTRRGSSCVLSKGGRGTTSVGPPPHSRCPRLAQCPLPFFSASHLSTKKNQGSCRILQKLLKLKIKAAGELRLNPKYVRKGSHTWRSMSRLPPRAGPSPTSSNQDTGASRKSKIRLYYLQWRVYGRV